MLRFLSRFHTASVLRDDLLQSAKRDLAKLSLLDLDPSKSKTNEIVTSMVQNPPKEFYIKTRRLDTSVYKMNLVANMLKGMSLNQAINQLSFVKKKSAKWILQRLENLKNKAAEQHGVDKDRLEIVQTWVLKGPTFKDIRIHGRGRVGRMTHPSSFARFLIRQVPEGIPVSTRPDGKRTLSEFEKIWIRLRRNRLDEPFRETGRIPVTRAPWSALPYKYLTKKNWTN